MKPPEPRRYRVDPRPSRFDLATAGILVAVWALFFGLAVVDQVRGAGVAMLGLSLAGPDSHPVLTGEVYRGHPANLLERAGLRAGDTLLRLGETDLRGVGSNAFRAVSARESGPGSEPRATLVYEREGMRRQTTLALIPLSATRPRLAASLAFVAVALLLVWRAPTTSTARAFFLAALCLSVALCTSGSSLWTVFSPLAFGLTAPLQIRFWRRFPDDVAPRGRWSHVWPWGFVGIGVGLALVRAGHIELGQLLLHPGTVLGLLVVLAIVTGKYRRGDALARRQIRWVLVGLYVSLLPLAASYVLATLDPRFHALIYHGHWALAVFPVFLLVAIVRFNAFDVDRILSAVASYNVLLVALVATALSVVPRIAETASELAGIEPATGQLALSLALAAAVVPVQRRLRPRIERVFFKERYALDRGIAELLADLSRCDDARELTERAGTALQRLLRPETLVVYARIEESYAPVFAAGRALPAAFPAESPLVTVLDGRHRPLAVGGPGRRPDETPLDAFDRAALATLAAEVVVPVRRDERLSAFLCLGPKRSGDVYTSTDLSLFAAVAETVARELRRFDQEQTIRESRAMQEALRRYVPGAVAEELASGTEPVSEKREVSVLFVDIRGYTGFAESRSAEEIFSTVNRYTETVSRIVRERGGSVVEFNGDGMMAVFGAPGALARKEREAVRAARAIVGAVGSLEARGGAGATERLSVGVGIATGMAFVGSIRAVDRMIWSAIGNTTNLAARLQGLTRGLEAAVAIDRRTWERAAEASAGFDRHSGVPVRGRRESQDVYALPMCPRSRLRSPRC